MADFALYVLTADDPAPKDERLARCARHYSGTPGAWETVRAPGGKPFFLHTPGLHFSVSHSGSFWVCAMGDAPVGADVQEHRPCRRAALSRRFFHPDEDAYLSAGAYRDFFPVWCAKESFVKYTGEGIRRDFSSFSVVSGGALTDRTEGAALRRVALEAGYELCLCAAEIGAVRVVRL